MKRALAVFFLFAMTISSASSFAGPSSHRIKQGPGLIDAWLGTQDKTDEKTKPAASPGPATEHRKAHAMLDGVWADTNGRLLLLKQIHRTLFLSGSSSDAAWQAQCIVARKGMICAGDGSSRKGEFDFRSEMKHAADGLRSEWTMRYADGHRETGRSTYRPRR